MKSPQEFVIAPEVAEALHCNQAVVALESTLIAHGLPWPVNLEVARQCEAVVRAEGAIPATIGIWNGMPTIGLSDAQLETFARSSTILKASRRDIGFAVGKRQHAATTVSATMLLADCAGISVFATGGIGGAHRPPANAWDISADLVELARTPVLVVCAGAKNILDLPRTLEILETAGVPVWGYRSDTFPQFYTRGSTLPLSARIDDPMEVAECFLAHRGWTNCGAVLAQPLSEVDAISESDWEELLKTAERDAEVNKISGAQLTPYLLKRCAELSDGRTLKANAILIQQNARLAAQIAYNIQKVRP